MLPPSRINFVYLPNSEVVPKRKKGRKEKNNRRQKKAKNVEEVEQDPHVVIAHGVEQTISPSSPNDSANLLKLTNQIASDASPTGSLANNLHDLLLSAKQFQTHFLLNCSHLHSQNLNA
jgi:hypothetical protein